MILITSTGEFLLYFTVRFFFFFFFISLKKKRVAVGLFLCFFVLLFFYYRNFQWIRNPEGRLLKVNLPQEPRLNLN